MTVWSGLILPLVLLSSIARCEEGGDESEREDPQEAPFSSLPFDSEAKRDLPEAKSAFGKVQWLVFLIHPSCC